MLATAKPEVIDSGPAGTGKSRAGLEKINYCCLTYPGLRALIVRKTRTSLSETGLDTFERFVLALDHPMVINGPRRRNRQVYQYPNGSAIVLGGMDKPGRILSAEFDLIFVQQAEELQEEDWEILITRLRSTTLPFQQIIGDCNPDRPTHWIKRRSEGRLLDLLNSRHEENPLLHDGRDWTPFGVTYIEKLDRLTGVRKERLRYGRWVQAAGVIYSDYDEAIHLIYPQDVPKIVRRYVGGVDWGYSNPGFLGVFACDYDDRMYLVAQILRANETDDWWLARALELHEEYGFETIQCDPSEPAYIAKFRRAGLPAEAGFNSVRPGITAMQQRFKDNRFYIVRDCVRYPDLGLVEDYKPASLEQELLGYVWAGKGKDQPVKKDDHGCDGTRYAVTYVDEVSTKPLREARVWRPRGR
jgi:phage terminase large subunit